MHGTESEVGGLRAPQAEDLPHDPATFGSVSRLLHAAAASAFRHAGGLAAVRWFHRDSLRILMYHRFSDRAALARQCAHIRRHYHAVSMAAVSEWLHAGHSLPPYALAVTVDDGYADFPESGYPVFAEYGIPATVFLVTDFTDGKSWLWFDRVAYAFRQAKVSEASIEIPGGNVLDFKLGSADDRHAAGRQMADLAVALRPADRRELVNELAAIAESGDAGTSAGGIPEAILGRSSTVGGIGSGVRRAQQDPSDSILAGPSVELQDGDRSVRRPH